MISLKTPNINGATAEEQLAQIKSYLRNLTQELNWALQTLEGKTENTGMEQVREDLRRIGDKVDTLQARIRTHINEGG